MKNWYVLRTAEKKEKDAARLLEKFVSRQLWSECRVLQKRKVFRSGGVLHLVDDILFPGYLFIHTEYPEALAEELEKSRKLPRMLLNEETKSRIGARQGLHWPEEKNRCLIAAVDSVDLRFLQSICGENLQYTMGITRLVLNEDSQIVQADGVLSFYLDRIIKLNLHKRFAVVEVPLFNRIQPILFGIRLEQDQAI